MSSEQLLLAVPARQTCLWFTLPTRDPLGIPVSLLSPLWGVTASRAPRAACTGTAWHLGTQNWCSLRETAGVEAAERGRPVGRSVSRGHSVPQNSDLSLQPFLPGVKGVRLWPQ